MVNTYIFSYFSGLKPNLKIWNCRYWSPEVQVAVCGLHCIDLNNDTLTILGAHFSYNEEL